MRRSRGGTVFFIFFRNPEEARRRPVVLDTSFLKEFGSDYVERAKELDRLYEGWSRESAGGYVADAVLTSYIEEYGAFTPIVVLAVPAGISLRELPSQIGDVPIHALIASGRFILADVAGRALPRPATGADAEWRARLLQRNDYVGPLNSSPIASQRFHDLMTFAEAVLRRTLQNWFRARQDFKQQHLGAPRAAATPQRIGGAGQRYHFISYSRRNLPRVGDICEALAALKVPLWYDVASIEDGEEFIQALVQGIQRSASLIAFCSPSHSQSKWCRREINYADHLEKPVLPVRLTRPPGLSDHMQFMLGEIQAIEAHKLSPAEVARRIAAKLI